MDESSKISIAGVILAAMLHDMEGQSGDLVLLISFHTRARGGGISS
jgi:hypothetical protein